jgi:AraC family transcriptional activator FtrA
VRAKTGANSTKLTAASRAHKKWDGGVATRCSLILLAKSLHFIEDGAIVEPKSAILKVVLSPSSVKIMPTRTNKHLKGPWVVAIAYDGLCTFEFGIAAEVFGLPRPEMGTHWYRFASAAIEPGPLSGRGGMTVHVDGRLGLLKKASIIIVPGWANDAQAPVPRRLVRALQAAHARGACVASICGGAFVLAAAGLLDGKRATTHWRFADAFSAAYPNVRLVPSALYVDEGRVLTSAGSAAGIDLCLHLVRRDFGSAAVNSVARRLVVPPQREGDQAQFAEHTGPVARRGTRLDPLLDYMRQRLGEPHPLRRLAARSGMSVRTFLRRFADVTRTTPAQWLLAERLARARDLLEHSDGSVESVAIECGFGSVETMRHHFRSKLGVSPGTYRARFKPTVDL